MSQTRRRLLAGALGLAILAPACSLTGTSSGEVSADGTVPPTVPVEMAPTTDTTAPPTTEAPTTTVPPTTTTTEPVDPTTVAETDPTIRSGSVGTRTKAIQEALGAQGYDVGTPDGKFGLKTTQAVWAFQALNGLGKDGVVGPQTEAAILAGPAQAMLKPEHGPNHTEVDLTRQVMIVWRDGQPALITHVSSGSEIPYCEDTDIGEQCDDAITPTGVYTWQRRISGWRDAPLGMLYNPVYFTGGFAIHGAKSVPNHPASHGCVRVSMSIAEYFPSLVNDGEVIEVFRS